VSDASAMCKFPCSAAITDVVHVLQDPWLDTQRTGSRQGIVCANRLQKLQSLRSMHTMAYLVSVFSLFMCCFDMHACISGWDVANRDMKANINHDLDGLD